MLHDCMEGARCKGMFIFLVHDGGVFSLLANYTIVICWYGK